MPSTLLFSRLVAICSPEQQCFTSCIMQFGSTGMVGLAARMNQWVIWLAKAAATKGCRLKRPWSWSFRISTFKGSVLCQDSGSQQEASAQQTSSNGSADGSNFGRLHRSAGRALATEDRDMVFKISTLMGLGYFCERLGQAVHVDSSYWVHVLQATGDGSSPQKVNRLQQRLDAMETEVQFFLTILHAFHMQHALLLPCSMPRFLLAATQGSASCKLHPHNCCWLGFHSSIVVHLELLSHSKTLPKREHCWSLTSDCTCCQASSIGCSCTLTSLLMKASSQKSYKMQVRSLKPCFQEIGHGSFCTSYTSGLV